MKKKRFFIATLLVVAAVSAAVVSCKKESPNALMSNTPQNVERFTPPQVADMNAYLKDFKAKMQNVTRDGNETLSLEEAAWHLSSVANYDFANANVKFSDLRFDTLYYRVNVKNGQVDLSDLNAVYASMANDIDNFYQNLNLPEKHFRFIGANISEDGSVTISMIVSYGDDYHIWIPSDTVYCDQYFDENTVYPANGFGMTELERVLNIIESKPTEPSSDRIYYTITRVEAPLFINYIDPYGAPNFLNSRIYCTQGYFYEDICEYMCYYFSSYHELGHQFLSLAPNSNEAIVYWSIEWKIYGGPLHMPEEPNAMQTGYHKLKISYGCAVVPSGGGGNFDY